jgi:RNA polymerase sigma factor (sigma-70 family)
MLYLKFVRNAPRRRLPLQMQPAREASLVRLLERYGAALRRLSAAYVAEPGDREDLFQEIALALWTALPRFRGDASERTWLYRIAHNVALTYVHKARRYSGPLEAGDAAFDGLPAGDDVEGQVARAEQQRRLAAAVSRLRLDDRRLILLYLEGLTGAEMAAVLGLSEANVATRLSRLRKELVEP